MPATITALLRRADLGMTLLAGEDAPQLAAPIRWVTTSELLDPTPYLRGGELLLTTGMRFRSAKSDAALYVSRLASTGVVGIGIGVGRDLAFRRPPARLVTAAAEHGLPLLLVDEPTPFIAIGEAVAQLHLADETAALAQALRGQQAITRAAVTGGSAGVVRRLAALLDGWVVVTDFDGHVRYEAPEGISAERHGWRAELGRLRGGHGSAAAIAGPGEHVTIQVLGEVRPPREEGVDGHRSPDAGPGTVVAGAHSQGAASGGNPVIGGSHAREIGPEAGPPAEQPHGFLVTGLAAPPTTAHHSMTNVAAALLAVGAATGDRASGSRDAAGRDHAKAAEHILDALARYRRRSRVRLEESLRAWLAHHCRVTPAAAELGIHRNTLTHRISAAAALLERDLGLDLTDPATRAQLWEALTGTAA